jgi:hypothetical protein
LHLNGSRGGTSSDGRDPVDWTIVLTDVNGTKARLALSHDDLLDPPIKGATLRISALSSAPPSEIVLRRYQFQLKDFAFANPKLDLTRLHEVRFDFDHTARGAIALSDVGLSRGQ